ncbi:hypothetical protein DO021_21375 [Desulfobacter hydrogenophilus]|uniref:Uncharacterized protein n=1 Tax=Desulfobacter hydrogenophilus TaxID=2291 RepID=A0A328FA93_9BACT|nr:hypothetical protein DO021_21375 [Desulfobacter hydrogenophilus]
MPYLGVYGYIADYCIGPSQQWWEAPFSGIGIRGYRHNAGQFDPVMRILKYLSLMNRGFRRSLVLKGVPA